MKPAALLSARALPAARVCVAPAPAAAACAAALAGVPGADLTCVGAADARGCAALVARGGAELTNLQGEELFEAGTGAGLVPLLSEQYGGGAAAGAAYFAVAVVDASFCESPAAARRGRATMEDLRGARSCHTGYRKTAGWTVPVGFLVSQGLMPVVQSDPMVQPDAQSVAAFFTQTCAPRATPDGPTRGGSPWAGLCSGCQGDCAEEGAYGDYPGALRCLMSGGGDVAFVKETTGKRCLMSGSGDVAFVKETTVRDYARGGPKAAPWSTKAAAELRLLCPAGGCATIDMFDSCNIARVPAYAFVSTPAFRASAAGRAVAAALAAAGEVPAFISRAVDVGLLTDDTTGLRPESGTFEQYFGASTLAAYSSMRDLAGAAPGDAAAPPGARRATNPASLAAAGGRPVPGEPLGDIFVPLGQPGGGGGGGGGLSGGAVAGIVIAVLAAAALAAAGAVWGVRRRAARRKGGFQPYQDNALAMPPATSFCARGGAANGAKDYSAPAGFQPYQDSALAIPPAASFGPRGGAGAGAKDYSASV
ncbi:MAG: hypothetical protein J3K34DRAFT_523936 [Monoraphidium minutum]|nr:MAG: hypothetical protein J3K34DRAFT_523936 [Monoraphidium minutum]